MDARTDYPGAQRVTDGLGATARATALIRPVKVTDYDAELHCDVRRVRGYIVECKCGWHSSMHLTMTAARAALVNHRAGGHAKREAVQATSETGA